MIYEIAVIGVDFTQDRIEQIFQGNNKNIFILEQKKEVSDELYLSYYYTRGGSCESCITQGVLLEIAQEKEGFELRILLTEHNIITIHSKQILITSYERMKDNAVISLYEVLWAAKVKLDEKTLQPITDHKNETSIRGVRYHIPILS